MEKKCKVCSSIVREPFHKYCSTKCAKVGHDQWGKELISRVCIFCNKEVQVRKTSRYFWHHECIVKAHPRKNEESDRNKKIFSLRRDKAWSFTEIGNHFGVTRQRIEQICSRAHVKPLNFVSIKDLKTIYPSIPVLYLRKWANENLDKVGKNQYGQYLSDITKISSIPKSIKRKECTVCHGEISDPLKRRYCSIECYNKSVNDYHKKYMWQRFHKKSEEIRVCNVCGRDMRVSKYSKSKCHQDCRRKINLEQSFTIQKLYRKGYSTKEISGFMTIKPNTIRNYMWRLRKRCQ